MDVPRPTVAPPGRLVRLGVVLDTRNPIERLLEVARMCDRAGIGALWIEDVDQEGGSMPAVAAPGRAGPAPTAAAHQARLDAWTVLALLAGEVRRARIGAVLDAGAWAPARLARAAATLGALTGDRFERTLRAGAAEAVQAVAAFREAMASTTVPASLASAGRGAAGGPAAPPAEVIGVVDDLVLATAPLAGTLAAAATARQAALRAGRGQGTLGVAARLPVSVGRTSAEAQARWEAEPAFAALGDWERAGLFGTLEQCHDRVVALAHAGVSDLRCLLPNAIDIHDVIAQLTAMTIGSADKLVPGAPRTRVPEPPSGWGGRSRFPRPG
jgi:alkanesulfonate monooxygenase SsuD/methylene tetrahydromethanopterin reductase-like flavin-dependent oxidoreductase (luciferase family)